MKDGPNIARVAALIGDHARAEMLTALMAGRALTATELAAVAGVTKQTVSAHLAKLLEAQPARGRERRAGIATSGSPTATSPQLLESLMGVAFAPARCALRPGPREPALRKARVCYDHLAGELGVLVFDGLLQRRAAARRRRRAALTAPGARFCARPRHRCRRAGERAPRRLPRLPRLERAPPSSRRRASARRCSRACFELGWARRAKGSRVVSFSASGEKSSRAWFSCR